MNPCNVMLADYERAERLIAHEEARIGLMAHAIVTAIVSAALILINLTVAGEFPWSAFAVAGMAVGLAAHWWFGYRHLETDLAARQHKIEERAAQLF
jgi:hypothetical protein